MVAPLPSSFSAYFLSALDEFELGPGIWIIRGDRLAEDFALSYDIETRDRRIHKSIDDNLLAEPSEKYAYLVQQRSGYIGQQKEPPVVAEFKTLWRQSLGALLAVGAIDSPGWRREPFEGAMFAHRMNGEPGIVFAEPLSPQLRAFYTEMSLAEEAREEALKSASARIKKRLDAAKSAFALTEHGRRLSVAAIWYLRSHISGDSLDGLLESTIALEALLGGGNSEGTKLSSLLGNRCAYLIGKSVKDRENILSKFSEIYTLRSKIVHEGHHKFSKTERDLLTFSRNLCRKALVREMTIAVSAD